MDDIPLEYFRSYMRMKLHFTQDKFNFFTMGNKTSYEGILKRVDYGIFVTVSKRYKIKSAILRMLAFIVSGKVAPHQFHITNILDETVDADVERLKTYYRSPHESFKKDMDVFNSSNQTALQLLYNKRINIETISLLYKYTVIESSIDPRVPITLKVASKYDGFFRYNEQEIKDIINASPKTSNLSGL